jgi:hypothetical protein
MRYILFLIGIILFSCKSDVRKKSISLLDDKSNPKKLVQETEKTIKTRFSLPNGFIRVATTPNTFENYLQNFKLKPHNTKVHLYNGELKSRQDVHAAILDIDVGKKDLQQCADATMRLRAEFLYKQKRYDDISFNFTNGFKVAYSKWRKGNRIKVSGNKVSWYKTDKNSTTYHSFKQYMQLIFMYAGTLSLDKEMNHINLNDMQIGDVFIQGGSPGHAIIVVDMAKNKDNGIIFMLAQSYMPAQEIHILKNFNNSAISPWYNTKTIIANTVLQSPEWNFDKNNLKRFP